MKELILELVKEHDGENRHGKSHYYYRNWKQGSPSRNILSQDQVMCSNHKTFYPKRVFLLKSKVLQPLEAKNSRIDSNPAFFYKPYFETSCRLQRSLVSLKVTKESSLSKSANSRISRDISEDRALGSIPWILFSSKNQVVPTGSFKELI